MHIDLNSDPGESFGAWAMGEVASMLDLVGFGHRNRAMASDVRLNAPSISAGSL